MQRASLTTANQPCPGDGLVNSTPLDSMQRASLTTANQPCPGDGLVNGTIHTPEGFLINVRVLTSL